LGIKPSFWDHSSHFFFLHLILAASSISSAKMGEHFQLDVTALVLNQLFSNCSHMGDLKNHRCWALTAEVLIL
jgi:hypothetical protein